MRSPKPQQEDPAVVEAREREQRRAETSRTEETQAYLTGATTRRVRRFGKLSSGGSVPVLGRPSILDGVGGAALPVASSGGGGSYYSPIRGGGGGGGSMPVLY